MKARECKQDELSKMTKEALESLCESLENGKSEVMLNYLDLISKFPKYSFRNLMLILTQKPNASNVMGYKSWKQFGRHVKRGEKAIKIWAPMKLKRQESSESLESRIKKDIESKETLIFRPVNVFDLSQTEGESLPEFARVAGEPKEYLKTLRDFATKKKITVSYDKNLSSDGLSKCGEIILKLGLSPAEEFSVLTHEIAHELMHTKEKRKELSQTQKEAEAEAVAYVVSKAIGLDTGTAASDYIQLYDGNKETIVSSLDVIQKTATEIIQELSI